MQGTELKDSIDQQARGLMGLRDSLSQRLRIKPDTPSDMVPIVEGMNTLLDTISDELAERAAYLRGIANDIDFLLAEQDGQFPTPMQSLALGAFMGQVMRDERFQDREAKRWGPWAKVSRGGAGLSEDYLLVELGDGYTGGIDREGRVST